MTQVIAIILIVLGVAAIPLFILWILARKKIRTLHDQEQDLHQQRNAAVEETASLLQRYALIIDAEKEATLISIAAEEQRAGAKARLDESHLEAENIIRKAHEEAEAIAGNALIAQSKAKEYEKAIKAMKNILNGYGDEYIIPAQNLLDDLANEYSFTDAGQALKDARKNTKDIIKDGLAAQCDYVEVERKKTAISFVLDAFNGKVDSILSRTKHDNYGKLFQEIEDAFTLVNINGAAFRNARITKEYFDARVQELKFGTIAFELREKDREEQRQIKERIREEERAQREYEKSMRDAAKQEEVIKNALEKARKEIESASAEKRSTLEARLAELEAQLAEAETRIQRAKSLAEQTKSGHVYVISNIGSFGEDVVKIGMTRRLEPLDRVRELGDASVPFPFDVHAMIYTEDAPKLETALHRVLNEDRLNKVNFRKEFFRADIGVIREIVENAGLKATFTMKAEAAEYRESIAINNLPEDQRHKMLEGLLGHEEQTERNVTLAAHLKDEREE